MNSSNLGEYHMVSICNENKKWLSRTVQKVVYVFEIGRKEYMVCYMVSISISGLLNRKYM